MGEFVLGVMGFLSISSSNTILGLFGDGFFGWSLYFLVFVIFEKGANLEKCSLPSKVISENCCQFVSIFSEVFNPQYSFPYELSEI